MISPVSTLRALPVLTVLALTLLGGPGWAAVLTANFEGEDEGGTGSAQITWNDNGGSDELTISIDNTSPNLLNSGSGQNSAIITGLGFSLESDTPEILSWAVHDGMGRDITAKYEIDFDDGFHGAGGGVAVETLLRTKKGIKGGFYNADAPGNTSNTFADVGIISIKFATPYIMKRVEVATLRMQRVGYMGSGSLKLLAAIYEETGEIYGVPVPGAAVLFMTGLSGFGLMRRRRQKSNA